VRNGRQLFGYEVWKSQKVKNVTRQGKEKKGKPEKLLLRTNPKIAEEEEREKRSPGKTGRTRAG